MMEKNIQEKIICAYSAKKNNAKIKEEYLILKPDTNSDSPSVKSKGALFISTIDDTKNNKAIGNKEKIKLLYSNCW